MPADQARIAERTTALVDIWRRVLGDAELDENTDLFDHGGTSLHVLDIVGHVYDDLGVDVRLRQVFENPSPRALAPLLDD